MSCPKSIEARNPQTGIQISRRQLQVTIPFLCVLKYLQACFFRKGRAFNFNDNFMHFSSVCFSCTNVCFQIRRTIAFRFTSIPSFTLIFLITQIFPRKCVDCNFWFRRYKQKNAISNAQDPYRFGLSVFLWQTDQENTFWH